ncbi:MAG: DUF5689 domain-containing protein, partial [Bacteroidia bacterium]
IRSMYTGTTLVLPAGTIISGTVIADTAQHNTNSRNVILQDITGGIVVRFNVNSIFNLNDNITIDVSGDTLLEFNGLLEINPVDISSAALTGTGSITPQVVTVADILSNMNGAADTWESTLVTIHNATISNDSSGIYSGNDSITDGTGLIIMFTRPQATFAANALPTGLVDITGYISDFFEPELIIRNLSDVQPAVSVAENGGINNSIHIFPNPGNGQITIESSNSIEELAVRNTLGQIIYSATPYSTGISLQLDTDGIYFVTLKLEHATVTRKIVVVN